MALKPLAALSGGLKQIGAGDQIALPDTAIAGTTTFSPPSGTGYGYALTSSCSGTVSVGINANLINYVSDTAAVTGLNFLNYKTIQASFGGSGMRGGRQGLQVGINQVAATADASENRNYVGVYMATTTITGDGGKGLGGPNGNNGGGPILAGQAAGGYFGGNPVVIAIGYPFIGICTSGSRTITGVANSAGDTRFPGGFVIGQFVREVGSLNGLFPEGTYIQSWDASAGTVFVSAAATASRTANLGASQAQYMLNMSGLEVNLAAQAGSSVLYRSGIQIADLPTSAVQGSETDAMISLSGQGGIGWKDAILIGKQNGLFPLNPTSNMFRATGGTVLNAFDMSGMTAITDSLLKGPTGGIQNIGNALRFTSKNTDGNYRPLLLLDGTSVANAGVLNLLGRAGLSPNFATSDDFVIRATGGNNGTLDMNFPTITAQPAAGGVALPASAKGFVLFRINGAAAYFPYYQ